MAFIKLKLLDSKNMKTYYNNNTN